MLKILFIMITRMNIRHSPRSFGCLRWCHKTFKLGGSPSSVRFPNPPTEILKAAIVLPVYNHGSRTANGAVAAAINLGVKSELTYGRLFAQWYDVTEVNSRLTSTGRDVMTDGACHGERQRVLHDGMF